MGDTPPYEGRRETADIEDDRDAVREGARVGGATGPVESDTAASPTESTGSPADEQPAARMPETDLDDDRVGPAHGPGTTRGEDQA
jgi:hypothetical protein